MYGLIHARPIYKREPDALSDPRRCRPFIKAGSLQTGEVTEAAASASALEARAGLTKINKYRAHYKCADCVHHSRRTTNRRMCRITPVPKRHIIKETAAYTLCSSLDISFSLFRFSLLIAWQSKFSKPFCLSSFFSEVRKSEACRRLVLTLVALACDNKHDDRDDVR